jgi:hypothetical protein
MRQPQLYDYVYLNKYGNSLFQVTSINHNQNDKYPTYSLLNIATLKMPEILSHIECDLVEIYPVPFCDIEFHFPEFESGWDWVDNDDELSNINLCGYDILVKDGKWNLEISCYDPEPKNINFLHDLQQYHRGLYGIELDIFGDFTPLKPAPCT